LLLAQDQGLVFDFEPYITEKLEICLDASLRPNKNEICKFFLRGTCQKGNLCPLNHGKSEKAVVCKHWLRGLCKKGDLCEFLHEYNLKKMPECWFFTRYGECSNPECQYLHLDPNAKTKECVWYSRGFCKHGSACRHKHLKRVACPLFLTGFCPSGSLCSLTQFVSSPKYDLPITYERAIGNVA